MARAGGLYHMSYLLVLQISMKLPLQIASDIKKVLDLNTFQSRNKKQKHNPDFLLCVFPKGIIPTLQGGISSSVLSVFFTDKFALSQSDARISVAYNSCQ